MVRQRIANPLYVGSNPILTSPVIPGGSRPSIPGECDCVCTSVCTPTRRRAGSRTVGHPRACSVCVTALIMFGLARGRSSPHALEFDVVTHNPEDAYRKAAEAVDMVLADDLRRGGAAARVAGRR